MKIVEETLAHFGAFQFSGIECLSLLMGSPVQIIIGTNGSGKSSLLRQLGVRPPSKNDFDYAGESGYRRQVVEHQGSVYTLISDFRKKSHAHQFWKDEVNLNEGGTTGVQDELVALHLGVTPLVDSILRGKILFTSMSAGQRKNFLIETNPSKIGFILDDHKRVNSKIRACKNNLSMLQERKLALEAKLIDQSVLDEFTREQERLNEDTRDNVRLLGIIQSQISDIGPTRSGGSLVVQDLVEQALSVRKKLLVNSRRWSGYEVDKIKEEIVRIGHQMEIRQKEHDEIEVELCDIIESLTTNEQSIQDLTDASAQEALELKLVAAEKEYANIVDSVTSSPIPKSDLPIMESLLSPLQDTLTSFIDIGHTVISVQYYERKSSKVRDWLFRRSHLDKEHKALVSRQEYLRRSQKIRLSDIPKDNCAGMSCPLYANFRSTYDEVVAEYKRNQVVLQRLEQKLSRINHYVELQGQQLDKLQYSNRQLSQLNSLIQHESGLLRQYFVKVPVLRMLSQNPMVFYQRARDHYEQSVATYRAKELENLVVQIRLERQKYETASQGERIRLETLIEGQREKTRTLRTKILSIDAYLSKARRDLTSMTAYLSTMDSVASLTEQCEKAVGDFSLAHEKRMLETLFEKLSTQQTESLTRLGEISVIIREQDILRSRYAEEVVMMIEKIEHEKKEWEVLEKALNRIPHIHTVAYINAIISVMNTLIAKIFVYTLKLESFDPEKSLDYKFPIQVGDVPIDDISTCSEAQTDMINWAFALALRFLLGYEDYPAYLDEIGASFDVAHKQRIIELLRYLIDEHKVSQIFLVNHHASIHEGLANSEVLVLNDANVLTPPVYNEHAIFNDLNCIPPKGE